MSTPRTSRTRRPFWVRALRTTSILIAALLLFFSISATANAAITRSEKASLVPYGKTIELDKGSINVVRNGGSGPTMVLLSGYGTPAPGVDFAPLVRQLDAFDVIVIEGFGYGYSDLDVPNRTIENITSEIHQVLVQLDVTSPVILVGHSMGGLYTHYYANAYPGEVAAIIGIDPMTATTSSLEVGEPSGSDAVVNQLGLLRVVTSLSPGLIQPPGDAYTAEERERTSAMTKWNYGNLSISDEWAQTAANSTKADRLPLPSDVPVLEVLSSESVDTIPDWMQNHQAEIANVTAHRLEVLEGAHYLHWTQAPALAQIMREFITENVTE